MDFWPADYRDVRNLQKTRESAQDSNKLETAASKWFSTHGPVVSLGGSTAALLRANTDASHLRWESVYRQFPRFTSNGTSTLLWKGSNSDAVPPKQLNPQRQAEEGVSTLQAKIQSTNVPKARFLRERFADVDIPFDLIKELMDEDREFRKNQDTNSSGFNCLAIVYSSRENGQAGVLHPAGDLQQQLYLSLFTMSRAKKLSFDAAATPSATFDSPICQIVSSTEIWSPGEHKKRRWDPTFAVRTLTTVSVFSIQFGRTLRTTSITQLAAIKITDIGEIADLIISPFDNKRLGLVDTSGSISFLAIHNAGTSWQPLESASRAEHTDKWRIRWASDENIMVRASPHNLELVDLSDGKVTPGVTLANDEEFLSVERSTNKDTYLDHCLIVTTLKRIIFIDERYFTTPLLSIMHMRQHDHSLRTCIHHAQSSLLVALLSQHNGLVTTYQITAPDDLLQVDKLPQVLANTSGIFQRTGYAFLVAVDDQSSDFHFLEFSPDVGLYATFHSRDFGNPLKTGADINSQRIQPERSTRKKQVNPDTVRSYIEVDFQPICDEILQRASEPPNISASAVDVVTTLERLKRVWQEVETSRGNIITLAELVLSAGSDPTRIPRAAFLNRTHLSSHYGHAVFHQNLLPSVAMLAEGAAWSYDLRNTFNRIEVAAKGNDEPSSGRSSVERMAKNQLELDLHLSSYVFSQQPLRAPTTRQITSTHGSLEQATASLSITDDPPPPVEFFFLNPKLSGAEEGSRSTHPTILDEDEPSIGLRRLLAEWPIGEDPDLYNYISPLADPMAYESGNSRRMARPRSQPEANPYPSQTLAAPPKIGMSQLHSLPKVNTTVLHGKSRIGGLTLGPVRSSSPQAQPLPAVLSQIVKEDALSSTQVLPGKFGGRPRAAGKKPKKHIGGF
ncbi:hypothetical protein PIIN_03598 [Serendipita indica DSM 11827]|uniref:Uncharacterized protein n=1 Tax=Serendipita indica (strain DSM 11827) TaxID=1109443 RepID=G4TED6_SERID|nr:hypothetical protein PIIN_03598 [Serendipita indica DSM 11827]